MDTMRGLDDRMGAERGFGADAVVETPPTIGTDERRMHVRAYNHWVSMLAGRPYPSIHDLDPHSIADFGAHSVLLDFTDGIDDPAIQFLGRALREECGVDHSIRRVAEVPGRSLLSRLTDHYLQIIANRAPIGFEAEFISHRGYNAMYRGILMPFSSDGETIDFIYGVINWKELVDPLVQLRLEDEIAESVRAAPRPTTGPVWADGPSASHDDDDDVDGAQDEPAPDPEPLAEDATLADRLSAARETAEAARATDGRSRHALYTALGRAYDFAVAAQDAPDDYAELLEDAGIKAQARAPMTPVTKLVFGADYDKTRLTEFAAALMHAKRHGVAAGTMPTYLERFPGGLKGMVIAERSARRPDPAPEAAPLDRTADLPRLAEVALDVPGDAPLVVLLGRRTAAGTIDIVACLDDEPSVERVVRKATARR